MQDVYYAHDSVYRIHRNVFLIPLASSRRLPPLASGALGPLRGYVYNVDIYGGAGDGNDDEDGAKASYVTRLL